MPYERTDYITNDGKHFNQKQKKGKHEILHPYANQNGNPAQEPTKERKCLK